MGIGSGCGLDASELGDVMWLQRERERERAVRHISRLASCLLLLFASFLEPCHALRLIPNTYIVPRTISCIVFLTIMHHMSLTMPNIVICSMS